MTIAKRSNIDDVAREANVSNATVSRALRGLPHVAASTRERVRVAAQRLDYRPDPAASKLASGKTTAIAMIVPILDGWYPSAVMAGAEAVLSDRDYELLVVVASDESKRQRLIEGSRLRGADGLIVVDVALTKPEAAALLQLGGPVVSVGMEFDGFTSVVVDDVEIGRRATSHLAELGHKHIAILSGNTEDPLGSLVSKRRLRGHLDALAEFDLPVRPELVVSGHFSVRRGHQVTTELLALGQPPSAIFCVSDEMAFGALRAVRDAGLSVPGDVSVIGADDHPVSWAMDLTTIDQQVAEHGALAARMVLGQLADSLEPGRREAEIRLVVRGSTGPAPQR